MKIKNIIFLGLVSLAGTSLLLGGCARTVKNEVNLRYVPTSQAPEAMNNNQDTQEQLAEAASSVGKSLQQLSAMQMANTPKPSVPEIDARNTGMTQTTSLEWYGPVQPLLEKIGRATGYRVHVLGQAPATPAIVSISVKNETMADILRNVTYQVHNKADIKVYPAQKTIEIRYFRT